MLSLPCTFDYWRNYKPIAPNLTVRVRNSEPTVMPLEMILQGARNELTGHSPTDGILDKVPAQRGWRLSAIQVNDPLMGSVSLNKFGDAFTYTPRSGYIGGDCFSYILTNGTQQSDAGTITLDVYQWYTYKVLIYRLNEQKTYHRFIASPYYRYAPGQPVLPDVKFAELTWYYVQYRAEKDDKGVTRIYKRRTVLKRTNADYQAYLDGSVYAPTVIDDGTQLRAYTYFDDTLGQGFDGDYNQPFIPHYTQGDIELEINLYTEEKTVYSPRLNREITQVDLSKPIPIRYLVSDIYGKKWWDSGNIGV